MQEFISKLTFESAVLWILGLSTLVFVLDSVGLMPRGIAKWLARNRQDAVLRSLRILNVRLVWDEGRSLGDDFKRLRNALPRRKEPAYATDLRALLQLHTIEGSVSVGETSAFSSDGFIDVIGSSTDPDVAAKYARILNTYLTDINFVDYDIVATPKDGSPILGYEFARMVRRPLVLGVCRKVQASPGGRESGHFRLDYKIGSSLKDARVLIVDDSTTGGRKMVNLVNELRAHGAVVEHAAVLFEPIGKGARAKLLNIGVTLHAIVKGPQGRR